MKKIILLWVLITLSSCEEKVRVITPEQARAEAIQKRIERANLIMSDCEEFEYKGHTYMYNTVRDGICAWHAGHCKCNPNR